MRFEQAVEEFLAYLKHERGCSPLTIASYKSDFQKFAGFLGQCEVPAKVENITTSVVRRYVAALSRAGYKPTIIGRRAASLKSPVRPARTMPRDC